MELLPINLFICYLIILQIKTESKNKNSLLVNLVVNILVSFGN